MGNYTNIGRALRAYDMYANHIWWVVLGRNNFDYEDGSFNYHEWPDESLPETLTDITLTNPDIDQHPDMPFVKMADSTLLVLPHAQGNINLEGETWLPATHWHFATALYLQFLVTPDMVPEMTGYRRISVFADSTPKSSSTTYGLANEFSSLGSIYYCENRVLQPRPSYENHIIEVVLRG